MSDQASARVVGSVRENSTALLSGLQFMDENAAPVPADSLSSVTLTLYDKATGTIINERDAQDVLNTNDVTIDEEGFISWLMRPADNEIVNSSGRAEDHVALFEWAWAFGAKKGNAELILQVIAVEKVP